MDYQLSRAVLAVVLELARQDLLHELADDRLCVGARIPGRGGEP